MTFRDDSDISSDDVSAGGGGGGGFGGGRGMMIGGGSIGALVVGVIIYFLTGSTGGLGGGGGQPAAPAGQQQGANGGGNLSAAEQQLNKHLASCTVQMANSDTACRIKATTVSLNNVWGGLVKGYKKPAQTIIMPVQATTINTACGAASADTGPFYCPADNTAVFQLDFMDRVIKQMGGSNGAFAQEYIVAHEWGHHIQTLLGDIKKAQQGSGAQGGSVRVELQADCYAGVWAYHADKGPGAMLKPLQPAEIKQALDTAAAIGDDTIQKNAGRRVTPESFSHGTSAQRVKWFSTGYQSGDPAKCNTFTGTI